MRMICPNCGAQYEVDDAVIPEQGRDVQCSNCGHTWFQQPAHHDADLADELEEDLPPPPDQSDNEEDGGLRRQGLAPDIADVLRQEAEHEAEIRRGEAEGLETQPDLGLDDAADMAASRSAAARARMARLRGLDTSSADAALAASAAATPASGSRRDLLPDVEEINSSLRASQDRDASENGSAVDDEPEQSSRKGGGRLLSRLIILVVIVGVLVYMFAPRIVELVPQSEPYMVQYVDWANGVRTQLNGLIAVGVEKINGLIAQVSGGGE